MTPQDIDLTGQVALVTGGGGGIGWASAFELAQMGADVAILDVIPERCTEGVAKIEALGRKAMALPANAMEIDQVRDAVKQTVDRFGRLDILVNNVGGVSRRHFTELTEKNWRRHIEMNLVSHLAATSEALPTMIAGGRGGSIVFVTSIEASRAAPGYAVYAACKAGLENFTRTLAVEVAEHKIRVNAIAPDYIATPGTRGCYTGSADETNWVQPSAAHDESTRKRIPLGRAGHQEECGKAVGFLCSGAASYITGTILRVDGGSWATSGWIRDDQDDWILPPQA